MEMIPSPWAGTPTSEDDLKRRFAGYLFERPDNPVERMNAARLMYPRNDQTHLALAIAQDWPRDPIVIAELDRLRNSGADTNLPSKNDIARRYINMADDKSLSIDQRMKALDGYSTLMGMKPKDGVLGGVNVSIDQRRVFVLPQPMKMDEWEKMAVAQQNKLIEGNVTKR